MGLQRPHVGSVNILAIGAWRSCPPPLRALGLYRYWPHPIHCHLDVPCPAIARMIHTGNHKPHRKSVAMRWAVWLIVVTVR